jgi:thiamine monophosphate synthase
VTTTAEAGFGGGRPGPFPPCDRQLGLYACVDSSEWVGRLLELGVRDIQLRIKDTPLAEIDAEVGRAAEACRQGKGRLWVNDYWALAVKHGAYGVHIGQEDLDALLSSGSGNDKDAAASSSSSSSPLDAVRQAGVRLGVSTHTFEELARAVALRPSYISLGPIYPTASKQVRFGPQGPTRIAKWRALVGVPLVVIGGIGLDTAPACLEAGADGICVISALTKAPELGQAVREWQALFEARRS